jgi:acyl-CoA reductase-like NAD-dependent aldehyde dehydrogenase
MKMLARVLQRRAEDVADRLRAETGKPLSEALAEVLVSVDLIRFYLQAAPKHLRPRRVRTSWVVSKAAWIEYDPYGVVGAITPWNYPFILPMDCVTPALFAGNAVVVKPSEFTSWTAELIPELCADAGLPGGLVQVVTGDGSTGRALVESGVDRLVFTGSTATGKKIMATAAQSLTPVTLELGGKDPAIVLEDADLERTARGVVFGSLFNAGQTCISVERVLVVGAVHEAFVDRVTRLVQDLRTGGPEADVGPMVIAAQVGIVERQVEDALAKGARALTGGRRSEPGSRVFLPTVLVDVDGSMDVVRDETFGPVLAITQVRDEADAVAQANASGYGLFASVWTGDRRRGERVARQLHAGGVSINDVLSHYGVAELPMGGRGASGFGRRRGLEALDEMSRSRSMLADRFGLKREIWWFPYSARGARVMRALVDWRGLGGLRGVIRAARRLMAKEG